MRRVLINNHHPGGGLRYDVILMHLRPRSTQRPRLNLRHRLDPRLRCLGKSHALRIIRCLKRKRPPQCPLRGPVHLIHPHLGPHRRQGRIRHRGRRPMPSPRQRRLQPGDNQRPRRLGFPKPHLGFGRMHVHIHSFRVTNQVQHRRRMPVPAQKIEIGHPQCAQQHPVQNRPPVHKDKLLHRRPARIGRQGGIALQPQPLPLHINP